MLGLWMTLGLGVFILIGSGIVFLTKNNERFIDFSLALALSVMIMLIGTDLIPEAYEIFEKDGFVLFLLFTLLGFILLRILDLFIPDHEDDPKTKEDDHDNLVHIGLVSSIALILHNIIEGMAVYSTFTSSLSLGIMVSIGVGLHNIPLGMVITSSFYQSNQNKKKTLLIMILLSCSTFLGGFLLFILGGQAISGTLLGILLAITLGMLIYISICELLPRVLHSQNKKMSILGFIFGMILLGITLLF